jgi:hypothetical protein
LGFSGDRWIFDIDSRAVGEVTVVLPTEKPCWPNPGHRTLKEPHKSLSFHWLVWRSASNDVVLSRRNGEEIPWWLPMLQDVAGLVGVQPRRA